VLPKHVDNCTVFHQSTVKQYTYINVVTICTDKNIDTTVEVSLTKPAKAVDKRSIVRLTQSPASGTLSPAVSYIAVQLHKCWYRIAAHLKTICTAFDIKTCLCM